MIHVIDKLYLKGLGLLNACCWIRGCPLLDSAGNLRVTGPDQALIDRAVRLSGPSPEPTSFCSGPQCAREAAGAAGLQGHFA